MKPNHQIDIRHRYLAHIASQETLYIKIELKCLFAPSSVMDL